MASVDLHDVLTGWRLDPAALLVAVAATVAYGRGRRRLRGRRRWPVGRSVSFGVAMAALIVATQSGIGRYDDTNFTVHMIQHLLLGMVVPFALVRAAPITLALQTGGPGTRRLVRRAVASRPARVLTHPVATWVLFGGGLIVIYLTPVLAVSARNGPVHLAVHGHLVLSGSLFLVGLVGEDPLPRPLPYGARLLMVLSAVPFHAFLGLALLSSRSLLAPHAYRSMADQRTGAALLWIMGELFTLAVGAVVATNWYRADQRAAARYDRRADAAAAAAAAAAVTAEPGAGVASTGPGPPGDPGA